MEPIMEATRVSFSYEEEAESPLVLDGISLTVGRGEFLAVLGHNGSGKSTLAKHFNAILLPQQGRVVVEGMNTAEEEKLYEIGRAHV